MQVNNVTKKAAYLRNKLKSIKNDKSKLIEFNNFTLLPIYNTLTESIRQRELKQDFSGFNYGELYFQDFNTLYEFQDFIIRLSDKLQGYIQDIDFKANGFICIETR